MPSGPGSGPSATGDRTGSPSPSAGSRLGVLTADFRLYHDLVSYLKERDLPFLSLSFQDAIPDEVGVVLTSPGEADRVDFPLKVVCHEVEDAVAKALQLLRGRTAFREIVVGVDPGPRPGVAILGDGEVVDTRTAPSPESVLEVCLAARTNYECDGFTVRVGHGDRTNRNRILNVLSRHGLRAEIVDEEGTTNRFRRRDDARNIEAAVGIARGQGVEAEGWYEIHPTRGEVKEVQRRSRLRSDGRLTISQALAEKVVRGEMTLAEAIAAQAASAE